jgi:hypothetical protein
MSSGEDSEADDDNICDTDDDGLRRRRLDCNDEDCSYDNGCKVGDSCSDDEDTSNDFDKVGSDDDGKVDHTVFEADDNNLLRRRRQDDDDGGCSVDSDNDDCVDNALSFS